MVDVAFFPLYQEQHVFAQQAKGIHADDELKSAYQTIVIAPYWQEIAEGGEFVYLAHQAAQPITQIDALARATKALMDYDLQSVIEIAIEAAAKQLLVPKVNVTMMASDPANNFIHTQMNGVNGYAPGNGNIWLQIDPSAPNWVDWIATTVAHEYHHSAWIAKHYKPFDLATYLIFEGRAESFVRMIYPDKVNSWTLPLSPEQEQDYWQQIHPHLSSNDWGIMSKFIFGNRESVPQWAGYRFGFKLVQAYIAEHPDLCVAEWTALDAHQIINTAVENRMF